MAQKTKKDTKGTKRKLYIAFLLDETGSMRGYRKQTMDGFNEYLNTLKDKTPDATFTLTQFNSKKVSIEHDAIPVKDAEERNPSNYFPDYTTPLYDAIAQTINAMDTAVKGKKRKSYRVLFVIMTDGLENASKEYTQQQVFEMISAHEKKGNWSFVYLGANQDSYAVGGALGMQKGNIANYAQAQTEGAMRDVGKGTVTYVASTAPQTSNFYEPTRTDDEAEDLT